MKIELNPQELADLIVELQGRKHVKQELDKFVASAFRVQKMPLTTTYDTPQDSIAT